MSTQPNRSLFDKQETFYIINIDININENIMHSLLDAIKFPAGNKTGRPHTRLRIGTVFLIAFSIIIIRRWFQVKHPAVWVEDGTYVVPGLLTDGWTYIFKPLNGYLIIPSKICSWLSLKISFVHYDIVSTIISSMMQAACVTVIARAPSVLPARSALAAAVVLVPVYPEVFGLPLYVFWWTTLLLFPALFWRGNNPVMQTVLSLIGGVSSPVVVALSPAFIFFAIIKKERGIIFSTVAVCITGAIQLFFVLIQKFSNGSSAHLSFKSFIHITKKFFGCYTLFIDSRMTFPFGLFIILILLLGTLSVNKKRDYCILAFCLAAMIAESVSRYPVEEIHPILAGPRYFFFPYILISWMLIYIIAQARNLAVPAGIIIALGLAGLPQRFIRYQQSVTPWPMQVHQCLSQDETDFQIQYDENPKSAWIAHYTRKICEQGFQQELFK